MSTPKNRKLASKLLSAAQELLKAASLLQPTDGETMMGKLFRMQLSADKFVHFTLRSRADMIMKSGKLLIKPPFAKFGIDHVCAISLVWGSWTPGVQTTHTKVPPGDELVGIVFRTSTMPNDINYAEEVMWDCDVVLKGARVVSAAQATSMLKKAPEGLPDPDQDGVTYR